MKHVKKDITIIEAESSPIDCRIISPGCVKVLFKNVLNNHFPISLVNEFECSVVVVIFDFIEQD